MSKRYYQVIVLALAAVMVTAFTTAAVSPPSNSETVAQEPFDPSTLTFELSDNVNLEVVSFHNKYNIQLAGHLYTPADFDASVSYPALIIGAPYGGVKEQGPGIYAQNMAQRGYVALTFDASYNGESGGEPRHISSPDVFVEDFSAAVDYLGTLDFVDRDRIGVIGICGSGGFGITAAQVDPRIRAIATANMYDISSLVRDGLYYTITDEQRAEMLEQIADQRWIDYENGTATMPMGFPSEPVDSVPEGISEIPGMGEFFEYYATERGFHPNARGGFASISNMSFMNFPMMTYIETVSPRPILFIIGEDAFSRYYSEEAYERAAEPKELYIVPGANHVDLYDRTDLIPFDKLETFFNENLG